MSEHEYEIDRVRRMRARAEWLALEVAELSQRARVIIGSELSDEVTVTKDISSRGLIMVDNG